MCARSADRDPISELTTSRLSVYLRCLTFLDSIGETTISSHELAERFHLNSAQIRKDLACFGEFGTRGVGYDVAQLRANLVQALGLDRTRHAVIIGAGNLGMALADYAGFNNRGFSIIALLDTDGNRVGLTSRSGIQVSHYDDLSEIVKRGSVEIGIIAVPADSAQIVLDALAHAGVSAILNFAPVQLRRPPGVKVRSVDLRINLESLAFHLKNVEDRAFDDADPKE